MGLVNSSGAISTAILFTYLLRQADAAQFGSKTFILQEVPAQSMLANAFLPLGAFPICTFAFRE